MKKILTMLTLLMSIIFLSSCSSDTNYLRITQGNYYNDIIYDKLNNETIRKIELSVSMIEKNEYEKLDKNRFINVVSIDNNKETRYFCVELSTYDNEYNKTSHNLVFKNEINNITFKFSSDSKLFSSLELTFTYQGLEGNEELLGNYSDGAKLKFSCDSGEVCCDLGLSQNINDLYKNYINDVYYDKYNLTINKFIAKFDSIFVCLANVLDNNYIEKDSILNLNFTYEKNTMLYIFKDNKFYYLVDAYEQGIITSNIIVKIYETIYEEKIDYPLDITLNIIYPWIIELKNILSITKTTDLDSTDLLLNNQHITDSRNINKFINWLCTNKLEISNSNSTNNSSKIQYTFNTSNGKRQIEIYDNKVVYNNHTYKFEDSYFNELPFLEHNPNSYSFNFSVVSGELHKNEKRVGYHDFSFENIVFDIETKENSFEDEYTFVTQYGVIKIYDSIHFEYDNKLYIIESKNNLEDIINKANIERYYIENPFYISDYDSGLSIKSDILFDDNILIELTDLNNYTDNTLSELFNCSQLSDDYLINNYNVLVFKRKENSHLKSNVSFNDLFIEGGNVYITKNYNINSSTSNSDNEVEFIEMILIQKSYSVQIKDNYTVYYNYTYSDGYKYNLLSYEYLDYIKVAEKENKKYNSNYENIKQAFGQYGEATAVMFDYNGGLSVITYDYIEDIVIKYPNSNVIYIYYNGHKYRVGEAYELKIISYDDVLEIVKLYNK